MHQIKDSAAPVLVALLLTGCQHDTEPVRPPAPAPDPEPVASTCGELGTLQASLSGAISAEIDWPDRALRCESMLRPDDRGVRLRLSGAVGGERLSVIIAMPALEPGVTGAEFDTVVTITVEGSGRFFSTPNLGTCWADVRANAALDDGSGLYHVAGEVSCVAPLGEFNGDAFVDIQRLSFGGIADWSAS